MVRFRRPREARVPTQSRPHCQEDATSHHGGRGSASRVETCRRHNTFSRNAQIALVALVEACRLHCTPRGPCHWAPSHAHCRRTTSPANPALARRDAKDVASEVMVQPVTKLGAATEPAIAYCLPVPHEICRRRNGRPTQARHSTTPSWVSVQRAARRRKATSSSALMHTCPRYDRGVDLSATRDVGTIRVRGNETHTPREGTSPTHRHIKLVRKPQKALVDGTGQRATGALGVLTSGTACTANPNPLGPSLGVQR